MVSTFQFEFGRSSGAQRRETGATRLLLLGDFSARAHRGIGEATSIARRPAISVDVDSLDTAIATYAPRIEATFDEGAVATFAPRRIDDFHPDRLVEQHPGLSSLMALRRRLLDPSQFSAAAEEMGAAASTTPGASAPEADQDTLGRLLGATAAKSAPGSNPSAASTVAAFLRNTVPVDHRARALEFQPQYLEVVDASATAQLSAFLHMAPFRDLEASWRGVEFLVSRLDLGEELELYLLDVTFDELRADMAQAAADGSASGLTRRLRSLADEARDADATWLLAGGLFQFGSDDLDLLRAVGAAARTAGIPFVAAADATIAGAFPDPSDWRRPDESTVARWQALRGTEPASSIGLVCPRILLRQPYGKNTDAIEGFAFEELTGHATPTTSLLWGNGALAAMLVRARAGEEGAFDIADLPALTYSEDGGRALQPCAEWLIGERVADQLTDYGLMPLLGSRHRNAVRLATWRSIALPR